MLVVLLISTSVMSSFASPALDDASISYSVKGYATQYSVEPSYTSYTYITSDGSVNTTDRYCAVTDYFSVTPGTYVFLYYPTNFVFIQINFCCFYDSDHNVIPGGFDGDLTPSGTVSSIIVPHNASFARITHLYGLRACVVSSLFEVNSSNYTYVFHEINDITISDGLITIPYQIYGYTSVLLDFEFYDNNYYASSFSLDVFSYLTASYIDGKYVLEYNEGNYISLYRYFDDNSDSVQYEFLDDSVNNPTSFTEAFDNRVPFRGFRLYIPVSYRGGTGSVSSNLIVELSNFMLDSYSAQAIDEVKSIYKKLSDYSLDHLTEVVLNDILNNVDNASNSVEDVRFLSIFDGIYGYGIIPALITLSLCISFVGYLLFGKSG